ncbi:PorV/PorQ family protein [Aurantibacillus circumpalustris]|uniref:PorV/PorQ family protein n=1 Tax=Aurantibacillus circumpalustris TaxID=3036359 RepID=UPI00295C14F2|nr:PorV/PorQ family protein [Aurantibacillus circumpalustris]
MKINLKYLAIPVSLALGLSVNAGNPERTGQAGASQLLINPFARNTGMAGSNSARVRGLEAQFLNVAGTAYTRKTEVLFNRSNWLQGTDIFINTFGITQGIGETGTIGLGVVAINAGKIPITTEEQPEGGLGTYSPSFYNISLSYAKMFSDNIFGGVNFKLVNEQIPNAAAHGLAIDAGIQYHTGKYDQVHFGIALRNWGPKMSYVGDGLSRQAVATSINGSYELTVNNRSAGFELPTMVNIGASYDFYLTKDSTGLLKQHRLSIHGNFTSNSFSYDNGMVGLEYAWKEMLMFRVGSFVEKNMFNDDQRRNAFTGPSAGLTFEVPFNEKKSTIGLDYSYRFSNPFGGTHSFGLRLNL